MAAVSVALCSAGKDKASPAKSAQEPPPAEVGPSVTIDFSKLPSSTFLMPTAANQLRDPFFPKATVVAQVATQTRTNTTPAVDVNLFVLNGLTGPPLRSAIINGRTFLQGEEAEVRLQSGARVVIKCAAIEDERAIIEVAGTRRELRLRLGI